MNFLKHFFETLSFIRSMPNTSFQRSRTLEGWVKDLIIHIEGKFWVPYTVWGGADKSLARSGRKQATATKLGIYSVYTQWRSIHFLAHCSNFCKPLKKKIQEVVRPTRSLGSNDLRVGQKMATFQLFFQCREQVVVLQGQIHRIGLVIKTLDPR
jgi:hypothetical protein